MIAFSLKLGVWIVYYHVHFLIHLWILYLKNCSADFFEKWLNLLEIRSSIRYKKISPNRVRFGGFRLYCCFGDYWLWVLVGVGAEFESVDI